MNFKINRRRFLGQMLGGLTAMMVARMGWLFPERARVNEYSNVPVPAGSHLPPNVTIEQLSGTEALKVVEQALSDASALRLQASLPRFKRESEGARAMIVSWADEGTGARHMGPASAVPFVDENGAVAVLFFSAIDGDAQAAMVTLKLEGKVIQGASVYQLKDGAVVEEEVDVKSVASRARNGVASPAGPCTVNCLISCLQQFGCSGLAFTLCVAALLGCVVALPVCIAAYACTLYCGGAWSICWQNICCG